MVIDFGNGIRATTTVTDASAPFGIVGHSGADFPALEVPVTESGVLDGGTVGTTRAKMRRMAFKLHHDGTVTRRQVMAAFSPGVERTISSELGSMPYFVEALTFPENLLRAEHDFSVSIVSPLGYALGAQESADIEGGGGWTTEAVDSSDTTPVLYVSIAGMPIAVNLTLTEGRHRGITITLRNDSGDYQMLPSVKLYDSTGSTLLAEGSLPVGGGMGLLPPAFHDEVRFVWDTYLTAASYKVIVGTSSLFLRCGGGIGSPVLWHKTWYQTFTGASASVTFISDTDVSCSPQITCVIQGPDTALVLTSGQVVATEAVDPAALLFEDEFDTTPVLDESRPNGWYDGWQWEGHTVTGTYPDIAYYDHTANFEATTTGLRIKSEKRTVGGKSYASGAATTWAPFTYGYFECRAKLPKGGSIFPSFWLAGARTIDGVPVASVDSEIDIIEYAGNAPGVIYTNLHYMDGASHYDAAWRDESAFYTDPPADWSTDYHKFAADWQPGYVRFYIDDQLVREITDGETVNGHAVVIPSNPHWIVIGTRMNTHYAGAVVDAQLPVYFNIDYVRVYANKGGTVLREFSVADPGWMTTITGALSADDIVVIDSDAHTVTVNGVNKLAWFDRTGDWPRVNPGLNTIGIDPAAATSISWRPKRMGLL